MSIKNNILNQRFYTYLQFQDALVVVFHFQGQLLECLIPKHYKLVLKSYKFIIKQNKGSDFISFLIISNVDYPYQIATNANFN